MTVLYRRSISRGSSREPCRVGGVAVRVLDSVSNRVAGSMLRPRPSGLVTSGSAAVCQLSALLSVKGGEPISDLNPPGKDEPVDGISEGMRRLEFGDNARVRDNEGPAREECDTVRRCGRGMTESAACPKLRGAFLSWLYPYPCEAAVPVESRGGTGGGGASASWTSRRAGSAV